MRTRYSTFCLTALSMAMLFSGCSSLQISAPSTGDTDQMAANNQTNIIVVKKSANKEPVATTIPHNPAMVVDEALEKSGGKNWFGRAKIQIVRNSQVGEKLKMDVEYNNSSKQVEPLYDYALRAGDRVIVEEDNSNALTDLIDQLNPL
ncbi:MAG: hypothetical protein ACI9G1_002934 [Pirellulaceae bacterium]|jgi:hypothetical protein